MDTTLLGHILVLFLSVDLLPVDRWRSTVALRGRETQGDIIVEGLALLKIYTGISISTSGYFYCDTVIFNRHTLISRF